VEHFVFCHPDSSLLNTAVFCKLCPACRRIIIMLVGPPRWLGSGLLTDSGSHELSAVILPWQLRRLPRARSRRSPRWLSGDANVVKLLCEGTD
jgi:hypothetical protein